MQVAYGVVCAFILAASDAGSGALQNAHGGDEPEMSGTSSYGVPGVRRVAAAHNRGAGALFLQLEGGYGSAGSVLVAHDQLQLQTESVRLGYAPSRNWEWMFGAVTRGAADSAYYSGSASTWTQFQLQGAYHRKLAPLWHAGASLLVNLPAQTSGLGFAWAALGGEVQARASWQFHTRAEASINLAFVLDRTERLIVTPASRLQRLTLNSAQGSRASWGIGVDGWFNPKDLVAVGGFVETSGQWSPAAAARNLPILASLGLRAVPRVFPYVELSVGVDTRLLGAPEPDDWYAGLLPWFLFAQVTVHIRPFFELEPPACKPGALPKPPPVRPQQANDLLTPPAPPAAPDEVPPAPARRQSVISGSVLTTRGRPVAGVRIVLQGHEDVLFTADHQTGRFRTQPVTCDPNITVTAITLQGEQASGVVVCDQPFPPEITLIPRKAPLAEGVVVFNVAGPGWKPPAVGSVHCDGFKSGPQRIAPDAPLRLSLPPRIYKCTISVPKFVKQHRVLHVHANDTAVFNIELEPDRPKGARPHSVRPQ